MKFKYTSNRKIDEDIVYSMIGMALVSAQRVEFIAGQLIEHLAEFDNNIYGITSKEFLNNKELHKHRKSLGKIFSLHKLNPKLVIEEVLDLYLDKRNILVHEFWKKYLNSKSLEQSDRAMQFCNEFGMLSNALESFFKGFLYFLAIKHVKVDDNLDPEMKTWRKDFDFFLASLDKKEFWREEFKNIKK